jgi:hypothetical protein
MATVTAGYTWTSGEVVTPAKMNSAATPTVVVADNEITTAKILDANVTAAKLAATLDLSSKTLTLPDGNVTLAKLVTAVQNALVPVGAVQAFARSTAPAGWLAANGDSIGNASSNATHAAATYGALFTVLWDNWSNTDLPILTSGGAASTRGADAATDFAANKRLPLPDLRGIFVRGSGSQTISGITYNKTFAAKEGDTFQGHIHSQEPSAGLGGLGFNNGAGAIAYNGTQTGNPISDGGNGTPRTGTETRPANIALLYCIKF